MLDTTKIVSKNIRNIANNFFDKTVLKRLHSLLCINAIIHHL